MCDIKTQLLSDDGAAAICDTLSDTVSMTSDVSNDQIYQQIVLQHNDHLLQQHQQQLHQTTQSLMMASSMLVGSSSSNTNNVGGEQTNINNINNNNNFNTDHDDLVTNHNHGHYSSANVFGSIDSMNGPLMSLPLNNMPAMSSSRSSMVGHLIMNSTSNLKTMHINVHELIMENHALREKLKEVTTDRDRLVCEVSNLRLEMDMIELKRLPEER